MRTRLLTPAAHAGTLIALATTPAWATEVVWLSPPDATDAALVATQAQASRPPLEPVDLRAAATAWTSEDDEALDALAAALAAVRPFETRLDGELVIMRDLMRPIDRVTVLRDAADRDALFAALAYQGFAVNRFFGDQLGEDPDALAYTTWIAELPTEKPWVDAVALQPEREITAYDIAEAPQRVAFSRVRDRVLGALPASIVPGELPEGAVIVVDGERRRAGPTGSIRVVTGRHLVHVELDGRIVWREDLRLAPGQETTLDVPLTDEIFTAFVAAVRADGAPPVPEPLIPSIEALGGEVWLAEADERDIRVWSVSSVGVTEVPVQRPRTGGTSREGGPSASVALLGGWMSSASFAFDAPNPDFDFAQVNAWTLGLDLAGDLDVGSARLAVGVNTVFTGGDDHVAYYGSSTTRLRPYVYLAGGLPVAQLTAGWTFPHHPTLGVRSQLAIAGDVELHGAAWLGVGTTRDRDSGPDYVSRPLYAASLGAGYRFR